MRRILPAVLLALSPAAQAQTPDPLTREYVVKLAHVYGEIQGLKFVSEICNDSFPELAAANDAAWQGWSSKYRAFVEEIEQRWKSAASRLTRPGAEARGDIASLIDDRLRSSKADLALRMKSRGEEEFRKNCEASFRALLASERANFERQFAPLVGTIRKGYGENFVRPEPANAAAQRLVDGFRLSEFPAAGEQAAVRLLDSGKADKRELRSRFVAGSVHTGIITMHLAMSVETDGQRPPRSRVPGMEVAMVFRIAEVDEQQARVEFSVPDPPRLLGTEGMEPAMVAQMRAGLDALTAIRGHIVATNRGVTKEVHLDAIEAADPRMRQMIQSMRQSMEQLAVPMPVEAVGVGARWKSLQHAQRGGMHLYQVATYTVLRIEGEAATLGIEVEQFGPPQEMRMPGQPAGATTELVRMRSSGSGETTLDLRSPVPRARASFGTEIVMNLRGGNLISQTAVNMEMQIRFEPGAAR